MDGMNGKTSKIVSGHILNLTENGKSLKGRFEKFDTRYFSSRLSSVEYFRPLIFGSKINAEAFWKNEI